ncbi:unnamed protein product [Moneuplotes crassus]|uniref:Uncharacterized protein n=1 Tax=Euplotes crassus TaxID=5936 RepID=A0AAD1U018_EUPCR|nr:unnamed protein product [Moneuplotes crassus]
MEFNDENSGIALNLPQRKTKLKKPTERKKWNKVSPSKLQTQKCPKKLSKNSKFSNPSKTPKTNSNLKISTLYKPTKAFLHKLKLQKTQRHLKSPPKPLKSLSNPNSPPKIPKKNENLGIKKLAFENKPELQSPQEELQDYCELVSDSDSCSVPVVSATASFKSSCSGSNDLPVTVPAGDNFVDTRLKEIQQEKQTLKNEHDQAMAALNKSICKLQIENTRLKTEMSKTNAKIKEADQNEHYLDLEICTLKSKHCSLISKLSSLKTRKTFQASYTNIQLSIEKMEAIKEANRLKIGF